MDKKDIQELYGIAAAFCFGKSGIERVYREIATAFGLAMTGEWGTDCHGLRPRNDEREKFRG